ncbi:MAG: hypothetical protein MZW92_74510 [Comamonadaceae bacterium]|nr:hypothetical protein [Comamonadaceae bacterium]
MKPDAMDRGELLDRVMNNYRRFYMQQGVPRSTRGSRDKTRRKYLMGCLKAFAKSGFQRTFYDLGRVGYWGPQTQEEGRLRLRPTSAHASGPDAEALADADDGLGDDARPEDRARSGARARRMPPRAGGGDVARRAARRADGLRRRHRAAEREAERAGLTARWRAWRHERCRRRAHRPERDHPRRRGAAGARRRRPSRRRLFDRAGLASYLRDAAERRWSTRPR